MTPLRRSHLAEVEAIRWLGMHIATWAALCALGFFVGFWLGSIARGAGL